MIFLPFVVQEFNFDLRPCAIEIHQLFWIFEPKYWSFLDFFPDFIRNFFLDFFPTFFSIYAFFHFYFRLFINFILLFVWITLLFLNCSLLDTWSIPKGRYGQCSVMIDISRYEFWDHFIASSISNTLNIFSYFFLM